MSDGKIITPSQFQGNTVGTKMQLIEAQVNGLMLAVKQLGEMAVSNQQATNNQAQVFKACFSKLGIEVESVIKELIATQEAQAKEQAAEVVVPESKL